MKQAGNRKGDLENLEIRQRGYRRLAEVARMLGDAEYGSEGCESDGQPGRRPRLGSYASVN